MKITGFGSIESTNTTKRKTTSSTSSFASLLSLSDASDVEAAGQVADTAAASAINNLLALQEISEEDIRRKKLYQRGTSLLDSLEDLRRQLLMGTLPPQLLVDISRQMAVEKQTIDDPKMTEIIEDIELRVAVEMAKIHKALDEHY